MASTTPGGLSAISEHVTSDEVAHSVIFDCTAEDDAWLEDGIHVVTANNAALSGPRELRDAISAAETAHGKQSARYLREVTVGGGLPVISTLRDLLSSGDEIRRVDGCLSVSWSYIMHRIAPPPGIVEVDAFEKESCRGPCGGDHSMSPSVHEEPCSFSEAVKEAVELFLMEKDPMMDLTFEHTAKCLMVIAKELGIDEGCDVDKILSKNLPVADRGQDFEEIAPSLDVLMADRVRKAAARGCVPRQIFSIDVKTGAIEIHMSDVPNSHIAALERVRPVLHREEQAVPHDNSRSIGRCR